MFMILSLVAAASMGPRFFKRGEQTPNSTAANASTSFNGATLLQAWRDTFRNRTLEQLVASMGPRFFKRGEGTDRQQLRRIHLRFNGATLLQAWRGDPHFRDR